MENDLKFVIIGSFFGMLILFLIPMPMNFLVFIIYMSVLLLIEKVLGL